MSRFTRIIALLDALNEHNYERAPPGVGLKTINEARELGFVNVTDNLSERMCSLTRTGQLVRERNHQRRDHSKSSGVPGDDELVDAHISTI